MQQNTFQLQNRRYIGSKYKLLPWISETIDAECPDTKNGVFFDVFSGTGIIANEALKKDYQKVIVNDFLFSNNVIYNAFFKAGKFDKNKLQKLAKSYNGLNVEQIDSNYFSDNFGDKYFSIESAKKIGAIRQNIEDIKNELTVGEYNILLASLIYSSDKIANTVGHYESYMKKHEDKAPFEFRLVDAHNYDNVEIFRSDANQLVKTVKADIVYVDPPYNSRQYSRFYHVLETLTKWDFPKLEGAALKPPAENMSEYCRSTAPQEFADLIFNLVHKTGVRYIVVSYNNTYNSKSSSSRNKITLEQITETLEKYGALTIKNKPYQHFNAGNTDLKDHREYLFILEVQNG
jgi:adenine-specific DNA-methyltransferase